jgi:hypothetical protein
VRRAATLEVIPGCGEPAVDRPDRTRDQPRGEGLELPRDAKREVIAFLDEIDEPVLERHIHQHLRIPLAELDERVREDLSGKPARAGEAQRPFRGRAE